MLPRHSLTAGIAIGPILFVIALLAILATAISAGSGSFSGNTDSERDRTNAGVIVSFATTLRNAVGRVKALGCSDTQINFENPVVTTYVNTTAPSDKHCNVFDPQGGGMLYRAVIPEALNPAHEARYDYGTYGVYTQTILSGAGFNNTGGTGAGIDLVLFVPFLTDGVCLAINKLLGFSSTATTVNRLADATQSTHFKGTYFASGGYTIPFTSSSRCIQAEFNDANAALAVTTNIAYFLLLAR